MSLPEKLRAARLACNLKQSDVAKELNCASTSFTNWESGRINPPFEQLEKMCRIYNISPLDLLDEYPTITDIFNISKKPISQRTYEDEIALSFCAESGDLTGFIDELSGSTDDNGSTAEHIATKITANTSDEAEVIKIFRSLTESERQFLLKMLRGL